MKYYYREHLSGYKRMKEEGKITWGGISYHGGEDDLETFSSREFLDAVLPRLSLQSSNPDVFELGTGTGPVACYLAERGYRVDAIDLIPTAIAVARQIAKDRNLSIDYQVTDVCQIPKEGKAYDMIVDSYCLQGIVLDSDRQRVFSSVHAHLKPRGIYLISTSVGRGSHDQHDIPVKDATGEVFQRNERGDLWDLITGVFYKPFSRYEDLQDSPEDYEDAIRVQGEWYAPNRRVHTAESLADELRSYGFDVLYQGGEKGENLVCAKQGAQVKLAEGA